MPEKSIYVAEVVVVFTALAKIKEESLRAIAVQEAGKCMLKIYRNQLSRSAVLIAVKEMANNIIRCSLSDITKEDEEQLKNIMEFIVSNFS